MQKVKQVTYVNGNNVADMSEDELISCIATAKADIAALVNVDVDSKAIEKKIAALETFIDNVIKLLDRKSS